MKIIKTFFFKFEPCYVIFLLHPQLLIKEEVVMVFFIFLCVICMVQFDIILMISSKEFLKTCLLTIEITRNTKMSVKWWNEIYMITASQQGLPLASELLKMIIV